jgi:pyruvate dehydrogenase E2 component (dihydrolipoamide acetyltransferase)
VNINVAVQTDHGLFVPVVRVSGDLFLTLQRLTQLLLILTQLCIHNKYLQDADKKGLSTIGEEVKQLAKRAKENSLKPQDYEVTEVLCSFRIHLPMMKSCTSL